MTDHDIDIIVLLAQVDPATIVGERRKWTGEPLTDAENQLVDQAYWTHLEAARALLAADIDAETP